MEKKFKKGHSVVYSNGLFYVLNDKNQVEYSFGNQDDVPAEIEQMARSIAKNNGIPY